MNEQEARRAGYKPLKKLPLASDIDLHDPTVLVPVKELAAWEKKIDGKFQWCAKCHVAIETPEFAYHVSTVHPKEPKR